MPIACSDCAARREWINKWTKVAYERAKQIIGGGDNRASTKEKPEQPAPSDGNQGPAE